MANRVSGIASTSDKIRFRDRCNNYKSRMRNAKNFDELHVVAMEYLDFLFGESKQGNANDLEELLTEEQEIYDSGCNKFNVRKDL